MNKPRLNPSLITLIAVAFAPAASLSAAVVSFDNGADGRKGVTRPIRRGSVNQRAGTNYAVTANALISLANEGPGTLTIAAGSSLTLNGVELSLQQSPAKVVIQGTLNLTGSAAQITSNAEGGPSQGNFELNGGSVNIGDWNNSIRSFGNANGVGMMNFTSGSGLINVSGIASGEQANYTGKFSSNQFFAINGTNVTWSTISTGAQSSAVGGFYLLRTDNFANGTSTISVVSEPSTYGLVGAGAFAAMAFVRRRRHRA